MKNLLSWHKRPSFLVPVRKTKVSHETNDLNGGPLFVIEKVTQGRYCNKYKLFHSIDQYLPTAIGVFKKQSTAKQVANLIYKDSRYAPKNRK